MTVGKCNNDFFATGVPAVAHPVAVTPDAAMELMNM